jgi:hypothetical protein
MVHIFIETFNLSRTLTPKPDDHSSPNSPCIERLQLKLRYLHSTRMYLNMMKGPENANKVSSLQQHKTPNYTSLQLLHRLHLAFQRFS